jgi:hypothetical protein
MLWPPSFGSLGTETFVANRARRLRLYGRSLGLPLRVPAAMAGVQHTEYISIPHGLIRIVPAIEDSVLIVNCSVRKTIVFSG